MPLLYRNAFMSFQRSTASHSNQESNVLFGYFTLTAREAIKCAQSLSVLLCVSSTTASFQEDKDWFYSQIASGDFCFYVHDMELLVDFITV